MREVCVKKEGAKCRLGSNFAPEISRIEKELSNREVDLTPKFDQNYQQILRTRSLSDGFESGSVHENLISLQNLENPTFDARSPKTSWKVDVLTFEPRKTTDR